MKTMLLLAFAILFAGTSAIAGYPYVGLYAGVYDDDYVEGPGGYDHSACDVTVGEPYTDIEMWIWWVPDPALGMMGGDFGITYPPETRVLRGTVTCNPLNLVLLGCGCGPEIDCGGCWCFSTGNLQCQFDWYWSHHQCLTVRTTAPATVQIVASPSLYDPPFAIRAYSCEPGNPAYACTKIKDLTINQPWLCWIGVKSTSWGAIKSLYTD